jgi:hypothetical protein
MKIHRRIVMLLAGAVVGIAALTSVPTFAQDDPQFSSWPKVEGSDDAKKYFDQMKKGEFDAGSKAFLERIALPQLAVEGNRKQIERIRRRMRDVLLNEKTTEATALDKAAKTAVDWPLFRCRLEPCAARERDAAALRRCPSPFLPAFSEIPRVKRKYPIT